MVVVKDCHYQHDRYQCRAKCSHMSNRCLFWKQRESRPRTCLPILEYVKRKFLVEMHQIAIDLNWPVMFLTVGFFAFQRRLLLKSDCVVFLWRQGLPTAARATPVEEPQDAALVAFSARSRDSRAGEVDRVQRLRYQTTEAEATVVVDQGREVVREIVLLARKVQPQKSDISQGMLAQVAVTQILLPAKLAQDPEQDEAQANQVKRVRISQSVAERP